MTGPASEGLAQSIKQRLRNLADQRGEVFNIVLVRFAIERLLYRITRSTHADGFILKGAMLFAVWADKPHRPTQDVDLLGFGSPSADRIAAVFREVCVVAVEPDGLVFEPASVAVEPIRADAVYDGLRVRLLARLGSARIPMQVDVGFGDVVSPAPRELTLGPMLALPAPRLRTYPPETVIAEKLDAIVTLGMANSRMKDYFDLWTISRTMSFSFTELRTAVLATAERRRTRVPDSVPAGLSVEFGADSTKNLQWTAFIRKMGGQGTAPALAHVVADLHGFLMPILRPGTPSAQTWRPGGPWTPSA